MASQGGGLASAAWPGGGSGSAPVLNRIERRGPVGLSTDLTFSKHSNAPVPYVGPPQDARAVTWMYWVAPGSGLVHPCPSPAAGKARQDDGERPSEDLRRTLDAVMAGKIKMNYYPSAKEYLEHLDAASDE